MVSTAFRGDFDPPSLMTGTGINPPEGEDYCVRVRAPQALTHPSHHIVGPSSFVSQKMVPHIVVQSTDDAGHPQEKFVHQLDKLHQAFE